ncbi:MAG TPA: ABC transporter permease [Gemmatimonadales bacterium]|nr:ABC transporter permease [Gemmatimonadales bacterium]
MIERRGFLDASLVQLTLVRFREFWREPEAVFWVFVFPILLATGLGVAFRSRPADVTPVGVLASRPGAERVAQALRHEPSLRVEMLTDSAARLAVPTGRVSVLVVPDASGGVEYRFDDTRPEGRTARRLVDGALQSAAGRRDPVATRDDLIREPGSRYIDFVLPGLIGLNIMGSGIWSTGFTVVDARKRKLLKRFAATPMSRSEYFASFLLARLGMLALEVIALAGFGVLAFGVPVRGSLVQLGAVCVLSALTFSAMGLLLASRARTTEGASGIMNLVMMPMWVFSGVFFASTKFPASFQPFIQALPLTAANDALRATMLEGAGAVALQGEAIVLLVWLVLSFLLALRLFRWQ